MFIEPSNMNILIVLSVAFALAMDAFSVSVGISFRPEQRGMRRAMRLSLSFGFFQFMMTILGWFAGMKIQSLIQAFDHWVAFGLLLIIGCRMILESLRQHKKQEQKEQDLTKGWPLFVLSVATSIDALAMGLTFAALGEEILYPALIIGVVAFLMTHMGAKLGPLLGQIIGRKAELFGGLILILIGTKILVDHL
jgi:putative Mn2+ efflux pump MntP